MREGTDRPFDWVAALAVASGMAVMIPSMAALAVALIWLLIEMF